MIKGFTRAALVAALSFIACAQARNLPAVDALAAKPAKIVPAAAKSLAPDAIPAADPVFIRANYDDRLGLPTMLWLKRGAFPATKAAGSSPEAAARAHLKALAAQYGLSASDVDNAPLHHVDTLANGATLARFTNQRDGVEVFRESVAVLMDAQRQAVALGGYIGPTTLDNTSLKSSPALFRLQAADAIAVALTDHGFVDAIAGELQVRVPRRDAVAHAAAGYTYYGLPPGRGAADGTYLVTQPRAKRVWFRLPEGLVPAYYVETETVDPAEHSQDFYGYVIAADDGRLLFRNNQTADAAYTYRTFAETGGIRLPFVGPQGRSGTPHPTGLNDGFQASFAAQNDLTFQNGPISTNDPWLSPTATQTIGNNAEAWANHFGPAAVPPATDPNDSVFDPDPNECDLLAPQVKDFHACLSGPGAFQYTFDPTVAPASTKSQAMAAVVNLFYMNNWLHDWYYDAGFREIDGNAQTDNFGRGGLANDSIRAQAQDYSGLNNANMSTPGDGARPRMRMYVFSGSGSWTLQINSPAAIAGNRVVGQNSTFGPGAYDVTADVVQAIDAADAAGPSTTDACSPLTNAAAVAGKIALVDRGTCGFVVKVKNAQNAGAVGVLIANTSTGAFGGLGGTDATITIGAFMVSFTDGNNIKAQLGVGVNVRMLRLQGNDRDGTVDNSIIAHEWGHYISNRLINDGSGLVTSQSRGMGEGWADFHAMLMMVKAEDALVPSNAGFNGTYAEAGYTQDGPQIAGVTQSTAYYAGLRRYPYSRDLTKNPLTFKHIQTAQALPASPPPGFTGDNAEVHNTGEVWTSSLWQCYSNLLRDTTRLTFDQAQDRMKRYLVAGYKLTPIAPTFIEARDAILAAMAASDPADMALCQQGFATRGLGLRAAFTGNRFGTTNAGVVESFDAGSDAIVSMLKFDGTVGLYCDADGFLDNGESGRVSVNVTNSGTAALTASTVTFSSTSTGVSFPNGATVPLPDLAPGASATVGMLVAYANASPPATIALTATVNNAALALGPVSNTFTMPVHKDRVPAASVSDDVEDPVSQWSVTLPVGTDTSLNWKRVELGTYDHHWSAPTGENSGVTMLTSPSLLVSATGPLTMTFSHRFSFEASGSTGIDGGVIEVSDDDGATWKDVETVLGATSVYNGSVYNGNPLTTGGVARRAFIAVIAGYPAMATRTITFPAALNGKTVRVRFAAGTDQVGHLYGWDIDDIAFGGVTNTPFSGYGANAGTCVIATPTSGTPQSTPVNSAFAQPLQARVTLNGQPMPGLTVSFQAPGGGATGAFSGQPSVTALTDGSGYATSSAITANGTAGSYSVAANAGVATASFSLTNTAIGSVDWDATTFNFGYQSYGTTSAGHTFTLTNTTPASIPLTSLTASGGNFGQSGGTCQFNAASPGSLAAGASCTLVVTFHPAPDSNVALNAQVPMTGTLTPVSSGGAPALNLSGTAEKNLVTHYYRSILRREPDGGGKIFWTQLIPQLTAKSIDVNEVWYAMAQSFFGSAEYVALNRDDNGFVTDLYTTFFNRAPDSGGQGFWFAQIQGGMPREVVLASFMFSPEFASFTQGIFGNTAARPEVNLVMDMYRGLLGRTPDSGGFDFWVQRMRTAQCASSAAVKAEVENLSGGFLNSSEFVARNRSDPSFVGDLYNAFLRRGGDNAGVQFWISHVGALGRNGERQQFIAASEFNSRVNAVIAAGCLP